MLKRNGEDCEHSVPNYPGLLTTSEHVAYQAAIPLVAEQVRLYNERVKVLADVESHSSEISKKVTEQKNSVATEAWQPQHTLFKTGRGEMLFCSRGTGDKMEYGVVEQFDPKSAYARAHGNSDEIMRGNNAYLVLQNFLENERAVLQLYRKDIKATVEEKMTELFPKVDANRVAKAVTARCEGHIQVQVQEQKEAPVQSIKIRR
jgi:hypothetical protein